MPPLPGNPVPDEVATAFREGLFALPERPVGLGVSAVQTLWRIPVVLVAYADDSLTFGAAAFDSALFDSTGSTATGSVYDYYRWASGNRMTVTGKVVATVRVAGDKLFYGFNSWGLSRTSTPRNIAGLVKEALDSCRAQVNWSDYDLDGDGYVDMLWVVHAGIGGEASPDRYDNDLWSITSTLAGYWSFTNVYTTPDPVPGSTTRFIKVNRFTTLPELSPFHAGNISEIGTYCHEFGHALGLPDLYDVRDGGRTNVGPGCWSLMGSGGWGGNNYSPEYPTHPGAWLSHYLGWTQTLVPARGHRRHADPDPPGPAGARAVVPGRVRPRALPGRGPTARRLRPQPARRRAHRHARGRGRDLRGPRLEPRELRARARAGRGRGRRGPRPHDRRQPRRLGRPLPGGRRPVVRVRRHGLPQHPHLPGQRHRRGALRHRAGRRTAGASAPRCARSAGSRQGT